MVDEVNVALIDGTTDNSYSILHIGNPRKMIMCKAGTVLFYQIIMREAKENLNSLFTSKDGLCMNNKQAELFW